jgi:hypothetical protein
LPRDTNRHAMLVGFQGRGSCPRSQGRAPLAISAVCLAVLQGCGGTSGREDLPSQTAPSLPDATSADGSLGDEGTADLDAGESFDVTIMYADQELPEIQAPPEVGPPMESGPTAPPTGPSPCTVPPCATSGPNSVLCDQNGDSGVCTATEAMIVARDISRGLVVAAGSGDAGNAGSGDAGNTPLRLSPASCYECAVNSDCIDNLTNGDTCKECDDLAGGPPGANCAVGHAALDGEPAVRACLDTLSCIFSTGCGSEDPPLICFCGTAAGGACLTAGAANGQCIQQEIDGLLVGSCDSVYPAAPDCIEGDPTATAKAFSNDITPAGMANSLVGCLVATGDCKSQCAP